jgi:putative DNA methylase
MADRQRVLIEDWLPITELGIESRREAAPIPGQFPKLKTLHVWWARRPLAASAGVLLNSLLPAWSKELAEHFDDPRLATEGAYRQWALHLAGIWGDAVAAKTRIAKATEAGKTLGAAAYGYRQAFKNSPNPSNLDLLHCVLERTWGHLPAVIDPTAGGGSIPYEAARYGLPATANDINAVAAAVLRAGVEVTAEEGRAFRDELEKWGSVLVSRCRVRLAPYFKLPDDSVNNSYIFARVVACPRTGKRVPLAPSWWLSKEKGQEAAARVLTEKNGITLAEPEFEILFGADAISSAPDAGSVAGGDGISIWDGLPIDGDYIKAEAKAGRTGSVLYAVAVKYPVRGGAAKWLRTFRPPSPVDHAALERADEECARVLPGWLAAGIVPSEEIGTSNYDRGHRMYGMNRWIDMFTPRQLLVHGVFAEEFARFLPEVQESLGDDRGRKVAGVLGLMQGKALDYNAMGTMWDATRFKVAHVFTKHNFSFKWCFAEFEGAQELLPWCLEQVLDAYEGIAALYEPGTDAYVVSQETFRGRREELRHPVPGPVSVLRGNAADLIHVESGSQTLVCVDPPYYDNVMYAELSDFFGVWEQHTVGRAWPDLMPGGPADQTNEAVANVARFVDFGRRKKELANADYQAKMLAIFAECARVLRDDGVMTVMFTHKRAEAWDTLGMALMQAGFEIGTSWPVNTESEQSLHQAKKNAAASTVMLVCRKRSTSNKGDAFFEDLVPEIKAAARSAVTRFEANGIRGVDLLLSTYGPVLSVISAAWPVYSSEAASDGSARLLRPEEALDVAREELVEARRRSIVGRQVAFDPTTDFWLLAWELFRAEEFPYDEARRLALAVGGQDPEDLAGEGILMKKAGTVVLQAPSARRRRVLRPVQDGELESLALVDILHGVLVTAELDGLAVAKTLLDRHGLTTDPRFLALIQGAVNAVPRTRKKGAFVRPEAAALDALVTAYLPSISLPEDEPPDTLFDVE